MTPALRLSGIELVRDGRHLLDGVDLVVGGDERWVVLGANGSGKTSLLSIAALRLHPSRGGVEVLGGRLGAVDVRSLRARVGFASAAVADLLRPDLAVVDVVMTAARGALEPWWHRWTDPERDDALACLARVGLDGLADRTFGTLSSGERQRVLVARTLVGDPGLVLFDEPAAGLDLGARERLVADLSALATDPSTPPLVLVTHHLEEVPAGATHALVLRAGRVLAAGPIDEVLVDEVLTEAFDLRLAVHRLADRWSATASPGV